MLSGPGIEVTLREVVTGREPDAVASSGWVLPVGLGKHHCQYVTLQQEVTNPLASACVPSCSSQSFPLLPTLVISSQHVKLNVLLKMQSPYRETQACAFLPVSHTLLRAQWNVKVLNQNGRTSKFSIWRHMFGWESACLSLMPWG